MTSDNIIERFHLQVDDSSELSTSEEFDLLNEIYTNVQNDRPWEWLKATATGNTSTSVPYIALPADFKEISQNKDNRSVVFVGSDYSEYTVIPFESRRDFRNTDGFCYIDVPNQRLYFTLQPTSVKAIEYDYIKVAPTLTTGTSPLVTSDQFGKMLAYGMSEKFSPIEQSDKSKSYANENRSTYLSMLQDFAVQDAQIKLSYT